MKSGNLVPFPSVRNELVLDTWPVMEWLKNRQPQSSRFRALLDSAELGRHVLTMSRVNLGEVYYSSAKEWGSLQAQEILDRMRRLPILYVSATDEEVDSAARLKAVYRISYADAFAASLAIRNGCPLLSGDQDFRELEEAGVLRLEWIGA